MQIRASKCKIMISFEANVNISLVDRSGSLVEFSVIYAADSMENVSPVLRCSLSFPKHSLQLANTDMTASNLFESE